jgi:hypothetical protein
MFRDQPMERKADALTNLRGNFPNAQFAFKQKTPRGSLDIEMLMVDSRFCLDNAKDLQEF